VGGGCGGIKWTICLTSFDQNQVMEQATDAEKGMTVSEFLDFKRRNKVCI